MPQLFPSSANTIARFTIVGGVLFAIALVSGAFTLYRSPFVTRVNAARAQTVPFSHRHHVAGLGIDCRYCHSTVETSSFAGIPPTETCMACHSQVWIQAELLAPVRDSWANNTPLVWERVNDLPDFVYFDHSIHISKGIGCVTCHGQVDKMPLTWKAETLHMSWCLDCHRNPEKFIRPRDEVFSVNYKPEEDQLTLGARLVEEYNVHKEQLTNCSVCHR